jgi:membrane protein
VYRPPYEPPSRSCVASPGLSGRLYGCPVGTLRKLLVSALQRSWEHRILGLAAEAGFWQLVSLPSVILAVLGTIGFFSGPLGADNLIDLQNSIDRALTHAIVPSAVHSTISPALHKILFGGRADVVSVTFIVALWAGSSAMATYVNTITIAYGLRHLRGAVRSRLLALGLYLGFVVAFIILLPALVLGPRDLVDVFPKRLRHVVHTGVAIGFWPAVIIVSLALLATLYHLAVPVRTPWRRALPGALVAMLIWVVGSVILRIWLEFAFRRSAVYGPLSAPVAVLLFLYLTALAILFGAEINAQVDRTWPRPETEALRKLEAEAP